MDHTEHVRVLTSEIAELERRLTIERNKLNGELSSALESDVIANIASLNQRLLNKETELSSTRLAAAASAPPTQGKPTPHPRLRPRAIFARSPLAPCSFYLSPPVSLPPCSVLSNLLCASGRRVCARNRLRGWESEIAGLARELSLWHVRVCVCLVSVCV